MRVLNTWMPVISDLEVPLSVDEVTASWGPRRARLASPRILDLVASILSQVQGEGLIRPELAFRFWPVESTGPGRLELRGGSFITSRSLNHHLPAAAFVAAGVCTIGNAIEQRVSEGFAASDRLRAVMLDEIGTLALFRVSEHLESEIQEEAERLGLEAGGALNPGEDGLDISQQAKVVELANGSSIGVSSTTAMLVPRKSISMVLGIGVRMPKWNRGERCALCAARARCPHRRSRLVEVLA